MTNTVFEKNAVVRGLCPHDCPDTCALLTTVENGRAVKVQGNPDHKHTQGVLCTKVSRYTERTYSPERLMFPLKRSGPKGSGQFVRVTWEEAIADIAAKLKVVAADQAEAILPYSYAGTMGWVQGEAMASRFFHKLGASLLDRTICASAGGEGLVYTLGGKFGMQTEFFSESNLIVIWGSNSISSNVHFWRRAQEAKRQGAKLICIDPRHSETAEKCHVHLPIKPGTDAALALAIMRELVVNNWLDADYIEQYTLGWDALRERAMTWTLERAAEVCGIEAEQIRALAKDWGTTPKAAIRLNYGMQRVKGGANAVRAIACLPALTGAWRDRAGGLLLSSSSNFKVNKQDLHRPDLLGARRPRMLNMSTIGNDLNNPGNATWGPQVKALLVYNSNPLAVAPQSSMVAKGFAREDLFTVVMEHFQTDTADYADYVLPATTQMEHWDVQGSYGHTDVLLNRPAIEPVGEAKSNSEIFRLLAKAMGFNEPCFSEDDLSLCRTAVGSEIDFEALLAHGFVALNVPDAPFAQGAFPTPSGRCEFVSERLAAQGLDPLPNHIPNYEVPAAGDRYPLAMISPPARNFLNSTFVNVESLRAIEKEPLVEISLIDAAARGISTGDTVKVFNDRGEYHCKADVSVRARPGVVNGLGIWWRKMGLNGTNVNEVTSQLLTDLGRAPVFYDCQVEVALLQKA
ncbi:molybdopterin-dependent oxidoreductase [Limnohabitans sp. MMS-10A-178]|uniref:molybdopterin-containing oxidoreductase family protein n=1 Tax=Limnohabitans sp. MMS-10A-178 TaxID=1835767 RepID=UPI000D37AB97|nr:molybdopterin oxidoreductase family protein [Limnohabitans sp. MMS-10A-178]PUE13653.1 molybdopterin oxidoreductase [Limnohabitans sp. MMS-10A-178]